MKIEQINALVTAHPEATCGDRVVFGVVLPRANDTQWTGHRNELHIIASDDSVGVYMQRAPYTSMSAFGESLVDTERAWLELASLEAPRLCALVCDAMAKGAV